MFFLPDFNTQLNSKIQADFVPGDLMCGALIAWLQENGPSFFHVIKYTYKRTKKINTLI